MFAFNFNNPGVYVGYNIYIFGGAGDSGTLQYIQKHNPTKASMAVLGATLQYTSYGHCSATLPGGSAYIFGGYRSTGVSSGIAKWDGTSRTAESATLAAINYEATCTPANGSNIYIFGGWDNNLTKHQTIQKWNGTTRTTETATLPAYTQIRASSATLSNVAFKFGGSDGSASTGEVFKWDGTTLTDMGTGSGTFEYGCSATLGTKIYNFGSLASPATNVRSWDGTTSAAMGLSTTWGVQYSTAQTYDNSIYIYGGNQGHASNGDNDSTAFDSAIVRWNTVATATMSTRLTYDVGVASSAAL